MIIYVWNGRASGVLKLSALDLLRSVSHSAKRARVPCYLPNQARRSGVVTDGMLAGPGYRETMGEKSDFMASSTMGTVS